MSTRPPRKLAVIEEELSRARIALEEARDESRRVSATECNALNQFNALTKELDEALADAKYNAPVGTEWFVYQSRKRES